MDMEGGIEDKIQRWRRRNRRGIRMMEKKDVGKEEGKGREDGTVVYCGKTGGF